MMLLQNQPSRLSASVDRRSSLLLGFSVFGTRKTSRSMANSWVSLYFALMKKSVGVIHGFIPAARTTHYRFRKECFRGRRSLLSDLAGTRIQKLFEKFESSIPYLCENMPYGLLSSVFVAISAMKLLKKQWQWFLLSRSAANCSPPNIA